MMILIVEDAPEIVELWKRLLSHIGTEFRVAETIPEAFVEMQRTPHPDLVLLDLRLPGSTEEKTLQQIAQFKAINPAAIVLVITGNTDEALPKMAAALGADGFRTKPSVVTQDKLLAAVHEAFRHGVEPGQPVYQQRLCLLERLTGFVTGACVDGMAGA